MRGTGVALILVTVALAGCFNSSDSGDVAEGQGAPDGAEGAPMYNQFNECPHPPEQCYRVASEYFQARTGEEPNGRDVGHFTVTPVVYHNAGPPHDGGVAYKIEWRPSNEWPNAPNWLGSGTLRVEVLSTPPQVTMDKATATIDYNSNNQAESFDVLTFNADHLPAGEPFTLRITETAQLAYSASGTTTVSWVGA